MVLKSPYRHIEGNELWRILKRLAPEHDHAYFRLKFFNGDLSKHAHAKRAFEVSRMVLGISMGDIAPYYPQIPLPLKKELEQLLGHSGKTKGPNNMSTQAQAGRMLAREVNLLLSAHKFRLKQKPVYKGKRAEMVFDMPKLCIAGIKILSKHFVIKEWELVSILLAGTLVYSTQRSKGS